MPEPICWTNCWASRPMFAIASVLCVIPALNPPAPPPCFGESRQLLVHLRGGRARRESRAACCCPIIDSIASAAGLPFADGSAWPSRNSVMLLVCPGLSAPIVWASRR